MRANWIVAMACALSLASLAAAQGLPANQSVSFGIHSDPGDANSAVVFEIVLNLVAKQRDGDSVGWAVEMVQFLRPGTGNDPTVWIKTEPAVDTADGLWWVQHQDADAPQLGEFSQPPLLAGVAAPVDYKNGDLDYSVHGSTYQPTGPFEHTAALTYSLSATVPVVAESGTDEPTEESQAGNPPT